MDERLLERRLVGKRAGLGVVTSSPPTRLRDWILYCAAVMPRRSRSLAPSFRPFLPPGPLPLRRFVALSLRRSPPVLRAFLLLALLTLAGCGLFGRQESFTPDRAMLASLAYPSDAERGGDFDIVIVHRGGAVEVNNLTARTYREMLLWLNEMYVSKVDQIQIGTKNRFELDWFVNRHGESYPKGGLLEPDKSFPVVSAELFDPATGRRHRLVVRMKPS